MNTSLLSHLLVLAPALVASVLASANDNLVTLQSLIDDQRPARVQLKVGMKEKEVAAALGPPDMLVERTLWCYVNDRWHVAPSWEGYDALVILMADGRVRMLKLTKRAAVFDLVARLDQARQASKRRRRPLTPQSRLNRGGGSPPAQPAHPSANHGPSTAEGSWGTRSRVCVARREGKSTTSVHSGPHGQIGNPPRQVARKTPMKNLLSAFGGALILAGATSPPAGSCGVPLLTVAFVALGSPAGSAAASATAEFKPFTLNLKPGSSPANVRASLGVPDAWLRPDIWIYWNFGPNRADPEVDTLVVAFQNDRLSAVKLTDGRVVRQLLAEAARNGKTIPFVNARARP